MNACLRFLFAWRNSNQHNYTRLSCRETVLCRELQPSAVGFNANETSAHLQRFIHDKGASARELKNVSLCAGLHRDRGWTDT